MLDYAIGFIINNIWIVLFSVAAAYNRIYRSDHKLIYHFALILALTHAASQIVYAQFVVPLEHIVESYYLFWAAVSGLIGLCIYLNQKLRGYQFYWPVSFAIWVLIAEVGLNLLVHFDRNIVALNGSLFPNYDRNNVWWLWTLRNALLNANNLILFVCLFVPFKVFKGESSLKGLFISTRQVDRAFTRVDRLRDLVLAMPDDMNKTKALQCLESADLLLMQWDGQGEDRSHVYCVNVLCDRARTLALYSNQHIVEELKKQSAQV